MKMKKVIKRVTALAMVLVLTVFLLPVQVLAEEVQVNGKASTEIGEYTSIIEKYVKGVSQGWNAKQYYDAGLNAECQYVKKLSDIGYWCSDIDGNGVDELMIVRMNDGKVDLTWNLYDLFTIKNNKASLVLRSGARARYNLCSDNKISFEGSGGWNFSGWDFYNYKNNQLKFIESILYDGSYCKPWFYSREKPVENAKEGTSIRESEAVRIVKAYPHMDIPATPLSLYGLGNTPSLDTKIADYWNEQGSSIRMLQNSSGFYHTAFIRSNDESFGGMAELYFGNLLFRGSDGIREGLNTTISNREAEKVLIGFVEENQDTVEELADAKVATEWSSMFNKTIKAYTTKKGIDSGDVNVALSYLGTEKFNEIFNEQGYDGVVKFVTENTPAGSRASMQRTLVEFKTSNALSQGIDALDFGLKSLELGAFGVDEAFKYAKMKEVDSIYLEMLAYLSKNATFDPVRVAASNLYNESKMTVEEGEAYIAERLAVEGGAWAADEVWNAAWDKVYFLKAVKLGKDLGADIGNKIFHTDDLLAAKDSMRILTSIGYGLSAWSLDNQIAYSNAKSKNDISEMNATSKRFVYAIRMLYKTRVLGEEAYQRWCRCIFYSRWYEGSLAQSENLKSMEAYFTQTDQSVAFNDYLLTQVSCPVNIEIHRPGGGVVATIVDGQEGEASGDGFEYKVVYNALTQDYLKIIQLDQSKNYTLKMIGNDLGTVDCKISKLKENGNLDTYQFDHIPVEKGTAITTTGVANLNKLQYTITSAGDEKTQTSSMIDTAFDSYVAVTGIKKQENVTKMAVGEKIALKIKVLPEKATFGEVIWESSNPEIIGVNADGVVTAKFAGKAQITATTSDGGKQVVFDITATGGKGLRGDVNADGSIDVMDMLAIQDHILGKAPLSGDSITVADVNEDGSIDVMDMLAIQDHILGKINLQ